MAAAVLAFAACSTPFDPSTVTDATTEQVDRVEPLSWWVGMNTPLQVLFHGENISSYDVRLENPGKFSVDMPSVSKVSRADSPNYLFVDVSMGRKAAPGTYYFVFSRDGESFKVPYQFAQRREGSADRGSFTTADLIYLIMPDRFANGDPSNDATADTSEQPDRNAFFGRHGGDIQGIIDHLDYLEGLGVTAIWNTPLLEDNEPEGSYHGYACTDYYHIDSRFGSNELYRELVEKGHEHGIKMIMDVVTNHCGDRHWWCADLPFEDWVHQWPEYTHSNCCFSMQNDPYAASADKANMEGGWFDVSMVDMNLDNPFMLQYFKQWAVWWIEWADLDGLRVDTYPYNEKKPMSRWCKAVRDEYPNINIVGEVWTGNVPQLAYWQAGNPNADGFDSNLPSIMDFPLQSAISQGVPADRVNWDEGMVKVYDAVANDLYYKDMSHMMIFSANHDMDRIGDVIGRDPERQKIVLALIATLRGIPQIFAGDEMMFTSRDRSQGHGGLRVDFPGGWRGDWFDAFTPEGRAAARCFFDGSPMRQGTYSDLYDFSSRLFNWRKTATAVHNGGTIHFLRRDNTYAYFRYDGRQVVFVFINNSPEAVEVPWADYEEFTRAGASRRGAESGQLVAGTDVLGGGRVDFSSTVTVKGKGVLIVEF